jgi:hypothetical protein
LETTIAPPDVSHLSASAVTATPRHFDLSEGYGESWEYIAATTCDCHTKVLARGSEEQHKDIDESSDCTGYVSGDGPMMNYLYALPETPDDEAIIEALADLPLCIVTLTDALDGEDTFLALTGGGMNMSWHIIMAYVRLGYLPPAYFTPPLFVGMRLTDERRFLLEACRETQRTVITDATNMLQRLDEVERRLAQAA